jgi:CHAT domain-containing protein/tetratricopeptide (TPR) repeat protein
MPALSFAEFESEVRCAEDEVAAAQWRRAFVRYGNVFRRRLEDLRFQPDALTETDLLVLDRIADVAVPIGETAAADLLYSVAADIYRGTRGERFTLSTIKRVHIALASDRFDDALRLAQETEVTLGPLAEIECTDEGLIEWERRRPWDPQAAAPLESQIYLVLGRVLAGAGQFDHASAMFRRGLAVATGDRTAAAREARGPLHLALAAAALGKGAVGQAETILSNAHALIVRPTDRVRARELEASAAILRGEFGRGIDALGAALEVCRSHAFTGGLASLLVSRAKLFIVLNLSAEAARDLDEATALVGTSSDGLRDRIARLQEYGRLRQQTLFGDTPLAPPVAALQTGVDGARAAAAVAHSVMYRRPADFVAFYEEREIELITLVQVHAAPSRVDALLQLLREDFEQTDSAYVGARVALMHGVCGVQRGAVEQALSSCRDAATTFATLGMPPEELLARRFEALCLERLPSRDADLAGSRKRAEALLASMTAEMSSAIREAFLVNKWSQREAEVADAATRLLSERQRLHERRGPRRWIAALAWTARVYALHRCLAARGTDPPSRAGASWTSRLAALWALVHHPRREQILNFSVLANGVVLLSIRRAHCELRWLPISRPRLRQLVARFHERLASGAAEGDVAAAAAELARDIGFADAVRHVPAAVSRLRIYPDDQLNGLPFAAIPLDSGAVVDRWAVTIGNRTRSVSAAARTLRRASIGASRGSVSRPTLPQAQVQVDWLSRWWRDRGVETTAIEPGRFNAAALFDALSSSDIVHVSGHGVFDPNAPDRTGIVVDGAEGGETIVSLKRLADVDCRRLMFATFLSCWSADSFLFPGRWNVSIPSTLCGAGAKSIMAPLWEIEDTLSTELLTALYARLPHDRIDEALRQAQLTVRSGPDGNARAIFFWASMQVHGDGGRLPIR